MTCISAKRSIILVVPSTYGPEQIEVGRVTASEGTNTSTRPGRLNVDRVSDEADGFQEDRAAWLSELFPEAAVEGKIDFEALKVALGGIVNPDPERYIFTWAGKRDAIQLLQLASRATLMPDPDASINFEHTGNTFIEGDNLEVLKLLYKSYFGQVKMIYIDPPYNTGSDFIYRDDYIDPLDAYLHLTGQQDEEGNLLTSNPETSGRYHSAWLSMMFPRLFLARQLLREDGVIFISIDDHEVHNLRLIMDQIFGPENFVGQIAVQLNPRGRHLDRFVAKTHEYLVVYARDASQQAMYQLTKDDRMLKEYNKEDEVGRYRELELRNRNPAFNSKTRPGLYYPIFADPTTGAVSLDPDSDHTVKVFPYNSHGEESCWTWGKKKFQQDSSLLLGRQANGGGWRVFRKDYLVRTDGKTATTLPKALWLDKELNNDYGKKAIQELFDGKTIFDFPKAPALIEKMLLIGTQQDDLVLDFFAGSCTTAQAVLELNRRDGGSRQFICVQLPEPCPEGSLQRELGFNTLADVGRERIRRVVQKFEAAPEGTLSLENGASNEDLGFRSFSLAPSHIKQWSGPDVRDADSYAVQMSWFEDSLEDGWTDNGVIWEVAIKEGYSLSSRIEAVKGMSPNTLWRVSDLSTGQSFFICLDDELDTVALKSLDMDTSVLFVCRDCALTDEQAANLALQCRLKII